MKNYVEILQEKVKFFEKHVKNDTLFSCVLEENRKGNDVIKDFFAQVFLCDWSQTFESTLEQSLLNVLNSPVITPSFQDFLSKLDKEDIKTFLENYQYFNKKLKVFIQDALKFKRLDNFPLYLENEGIITIVDKDNFEEYYLNNEDGDDYSYLEDFLENFIYKRKKDDFYTCEDCTCHMDNTNFSDEIYCFNEEFFCGTCARKGDNLKKELESIARDLSGGSSHGMTSYFESLTGVFNLILDTFDEYQKLKEETERLKEYITYLEGKN